MQYKHIIFAALLYSGSFYAAAQDRSLQEYTHEAFLDRIGLNTQSIAAHEWPARSSDFQNAFLIGLANTMRVLTQDESLSAQADYYTFMISRHVNELILKQKYENVSLAFFYLEESARLYRHLN